MTARLEVRSCAAVRGGEPAYSGNSSVAVRTENCLDCAAVDLVALLATRVSEEIIAISSGETKSIWLYTS